MHFKIKHRTQLLLNYPVLMTTIKIISSVVKLHVTWKNLHARVISSNNYRNHKYNWHLQIIFFFQKVGVGGWGDKWRFEVKILEFYMKQIFISYITVSLYSLFFFCFRLDSLSILIIQPWESHLLSIIWLRRATMLYYFEQLRIGERYKRIAWIWIC